MNKIRLWLHNFLGTHRYNLADVKERCIDCGKPQPVILESLSTLWIRPDLATEVHAQFKNYGVDSEEDIINRLIENKNYLEANV